MRHIYLRCEYFKSCILYIHCDANGKKHPDVWYLSYFLRGIFCNLIFPNFWRVRSLRLPPSIVMWNYFKPSAAKCTSGTFDFDWIIQKINSKMRFADCFRPCFPNYTRHWVPATIILSQKLGSLLCILPLFHLIKSIDLSSFTCQKWSFLQAIWSTDRYGLASC